MAAAAPEYTCVWVFLAQEGHNVEEDWYNKSLTALRMNNPHGMLQYQAWVCLLHQWHRLKRNYSNDVLYYRLINITYCKYFVIHPRQAMQIQLILKFKLHNKTFGQITINLPSSIKHADLRIVWLSGYGFELVNWWLKCFPHRITLKTVATYNINMHFKKYCLHSAGFYVVIYSISTNMWVKCQ